MGGGLQGITALEVVAVPREHHAHRGAAFVADNNDPEGCHFFAAALIPPPLTAAFPPHQKIPPRHFRHSPGRVAAAIGHRGRRPCMAEASSSRLSSCA